MKPSRAILYPRYEWCANELQKGAHAKQMKGRSTGLKHFLPCEKGLVFTAAMRNLDSDSAVTMMVISTAARTICTCHNAMGEKELWDLYYQAVELFPHRKSNTGE